jgi:DNA-binding response OmpR family regulator
MGSILLLGLDPDLAGSLSSVLKQLGYHVIASTSLARVLRDKHASAVFAAGDNAEYRETISEIRKGRSTLPIILVNRFPDNERWLNALELGAADYCGAPFERAQVQWLMEGALQRTRTAAAA